MTQHTKGKWYVDNKIPYQVSIHSPWSNENPVESSATFGDYRGSVICKMEYNTGVPTKEQAEANANFIVEACNNHDKLQEENNKLREALQAILDIKYEAGKSRPYIESILYTARKALGQ